MNIRMMILLPFTCLGLLLLGSPNEAATQDGGDPERERHLQEMADEWAD